MIQQKTALKAAERLYRKYNFSGGSLSNYQLSSMMSETYDFLKIPFKSTQKELNTYQQVLDMNQDGQVSLQDLQKFAINILCRGGTNVGNNQLQSQIKSGHQNSRGYNSIPSSNFTQQNQTYTSIYTQSRDPQSYKAGYSGFSYETQRSSRGQDFQTPLSSQYSQSYRSNNYQPPSERMETGQRQYSQKIREYLAVVGQVFLRYADPQTYSITQAEVGDLLSDTYAVLGKEGYQPSRDDISTWMKLCDVNGDGRVEFQEYEFFVVKSLERSGMNLYD